MRLVRQTQLHFREGNSDKIYEVDLCEIGGQYLVNFRYGRRGASLKEGTKTLSPVSLEEAEILFEKLVNEKSKKGYRVLSDNNDKGQTAKPKTLLSINEEIRVGVVLSHLIKVVENLPKTKESQTEKSFLENLLATISEAAKNLVSTKTKREWKIERVIWRAGELKIKEAAPLLVRLIGTGNSLRDYCIAWSLGLCGDEESLPFLSQLYNDPSTEDFVRRIAGEAMMKLSDKEHSNFLKAQTATRLPYELRELALNGTPEKFIKSWHLFLQETTRERCEVLELLYQVDNENVRPALLETISVAPLRPNFFRPLRYIFKAAEYRRDAEVFGILARRFENEKAMYPNSYWNNLYLKKDADVYEYVNPLNVWGEEHKYEEVNTKKELKSKTSRIAYGAKERDYLRRRTWRTLRRLGELGDATDYVKMAVGVLLPYTDADAQDPRTTSYISYIDPQTGRYDWRNPQTRTTSFDAFASYLLFNHILYENSPRYELRTNSRAWRCRGNYKAGDPAPSVREEAFPKLWEKHPVGLLHLLSESECLPVHEFAVKALRDCKEFCTQLDVDAVVMLLERQYEVTALFGFELAKAKYDPRSPNKDLVKAVATCANAEARAEGCRWIDESRDLYAKDGDFLIALITCRYKDTRTFAANLLRSTTYTESESQTLLARLIANLISFDETKRDVAKDLADAIFKGFNVYLRSVEMNLIRDLLSHSLLEVQELGGNILLNHKTPAEKLPGEIISTLIESPYEEMRGIGIKLFGQLPDDTLLQREDIIFTLFSHKLVDVHNSIRSVVKRLGENDSFLHRITTLILDALLKDEQHEGVHSRLVRSLNEDLSLWTNHANLETARKLLKSTSTAVQEAAGILIQAHAANWHESFFTEEIAALSDNEIKSVREASWSLANASSARFLSLSNPNHHEEISVAVRALDSRWNDSRDFWFDFFKTKLGSEDLSPDILVSICDSVKEVVQKFGRDLLQTYFKEENGQDYMLKFSEHPSINMQLFVTNYLERYASGSTERLEQLAPYFVRVLSSINKARTAKKRIYAFLETESLKNKESAQIVSQILERQSATVAIGDKAIAIELMLKIHCAYPELKMPFDIRQTEVRAHAV